MRRLFAVAALAIAVGSCSGSERDRSLGRAPSLEQIGSALNCDSLRGTPYDTGLWSGFETVKGRDCYREEAFFARIHVFTESTRPEEVVPVVQPSPAARHQPSCHRVGLSLTGGDHWLVVSRGPEAAAEVRELTGGHDLNVEANATTFTSYFLPCLGDAEPP